MPDPVDPIGVLRQLGDDYTAEQAATILDAMRESAASSSDDPQPPPPALTPAEAVEAERQVLGASLLEQLRSQCATSFDR